jgi:hypothetical protein
MNTVLPHLRRILQENELIGYNAVGVADYEIEV